MENQKRDILGIRKMRHPKAKGQKYHCENCKCDRFNPCTCIKK